MTEATAKPPRSPSLQAAVRAVANGKAPSGDWPEALQPVTIKFLARAFRMDADTVKKRLARCAPIGRGRVDRPVYDFAEATAYLVKPDIDLDLYFQAADPGRLPNHIAKAYWEVKLLRLKWEMEASEAWRTEEVLETFSLVYVTIADGMRRWVETIADVSDLSDVQRARLCQMVDALQADLRTELIDRPAVKGAHFQNLKRSH